MNELKIFDYSGASVRVEMVDGKPYFCGKDVAIILGYVNFRDALARHCKGVVKHDSPTESGDQEMSYIPEADVYRLVMRSKMEAAEKFQDWVVEQVLPSIRQTGGYSAAPKPLEVRAIELIQDLNTRVQELEGKVKEDAPKVAFFDTVTGSHDAVSIGEVSKVLNVPKFGQNKLFQFLRENGILMANNQPYQRMIDDGFMRMIEQSYTTPDGTAHVSFKTVVYQRGVSYIRTLLRKAGIIRDNAPMLKIKA